MNDYIKRWVIVKMTIIIAIIQKKCMKKLTGYWMTIDAVRWVNGNTQSGCCNKYVKKCFTKKATESKNTSL